MVPCCARATQKRFWPVAKLSSSKRGGGAIADAIIREDFDTVDPDESQRLSAVPYARELKAFSVIPFAATTL
jgi:hypothetical protein